MNKIQKLCNTDTNLGWAHDLIIHLNMSSPSEQILGFTSDVYIQ